jgi:hypothetical protein
MSETAKPCPFCGKAPVRCTFLGESMVRCSDRECAAERAVPLDRWNRRAAPDGAKGCGCDEPEAPPEPPAAHRFRPWDNDKCRDRCGDCGHLLSCLCHSSRKEEGK